MMGVRNILKPLAVAGCAVVLWLFAVMGAMPRAADRGVAVEDRTTGPAAQGLRWAVLIGIDSYSDPDISRLRYCVADAVRMRDVLVEHCGYDAGRILLLTDDQKGHLYPIGENLRGQTGRWLMQAGPADTVLVFYSGHGFLDENQQGFLTPVDCRLADLGSTGFRVEELREMLQRCRAIRKVLILDCCHAGTTRGGQDLPAPDLERAFLRAEGLITLASCRKSERSVEWPEKRLGLFTHFLTEGLTGAADRDKDGVVDSDEIYRYLEQHVPAAAQREFNAVQHPVRYFVEDTVGVFGLARYRTAPASRHESPDGGAGSGLVFAMLLVAGVVFLSLAAGE